MHASCRTLCLRNMLPVALLAVGLAMCLPASWNLNAGEWRTTVSKARLLQTPPMPMPPYLSPVIDPLYGTVFRRITEPGRQLAPGITCDKAHCRHRYSSTQAWNADQSMLVITKGCASLCFLDAETYRPLFARYLSSHHDCKWHPARPEVMICVHARGIALWEPRRNKWKTVFRPENYGGLQFGPYKGNPSRDGNLLAVRARSRQGELVAFAYDIESGVKYADIVLSRLVGDNHYVTISPSGRYVYVAQLTFDGREPAYVFTLDGRMLQYWPEHHRPGHGDLTIDADGNDVYVGISKAPPDKYHVIKRRLSDGAVTSLVPYGDASHVSARNIHLAGWVFVSFQGSYEHTSAMKYPAPFYREVIALRIDGSGEIVRIAQTRSVTQEYLSETHASPSPDGSKVIWASNWGHAGGPIADYVTETGISSGSADE